MERWTTAYTVQQVVMLALWGVLFGWIAVTIRDFLRMLAQERVREKRRKTPLARGLSREKKTGPFLSQHKESIAHERF